MQNSSLAHLAQQTQRQTMSEHGTSARHPNLHSHGWHAPPSSNTTRTKTAPCDKSSLPSYQLTAAAQSYLASCSSLSYTTHLHGPVIINYDCHEVAAQGSWHVPDHQPRGWPSLKKRPFGPRIRVFKALLMVAMMELAPSAALR